MLWGPGLFEYWGQGLALKSAVVAMPSDSRVLQVAPNTRYSSYGLQIADVCPLPISFIDITFLVNIKY